MREELTIGNKIIKKVEHAEDCKLLKHILLSYGFDLTLNECEELWYDVSERASAGWLSVSVDSVVYWLDLEGEENEEY